MVKTIADRLAEAFTELMHQRVRKEWGFSDHQSITKKDLMNEKYRGIRLASNRFLQKLVHQKFRTVLQYIVIISYIHLRINA